jgi:hypothetical protein
MKIDVPLKPPEYKRNELGQFDRPGSKTAKPNKQMGEIAEIKRSPGRPKGSQNKVTVALKEAILQAGEEVGGKEGLVGYLKMLARDNSSAYAGLLAKILPHQLAADAKSHGRVEIRFKRIIVYPDRREVSDDTQKQIGPPGQQISPPASHTLPSETETIVKPSEIKESPGVT